MQVYAISRGVGKDVHNDVTYLLEEQFFSECDIISLHAPLNSSNMGYIDSAKLSLLKPNSILINTARGGLINEAHLRTALEEKGIAAAYLDVLSAEPPSDNHILIGLSNCHITPHIAWATQESRKRLIRTVANNIESFQQGAPQNVVA